MVTVPGQQNNISDYFIERIVPSTILPRNDQTPIVFEIAAIPGAFVDMKNIQMALKVRIRKRNAANQVVNLDNDEKVAPINAFLSTFFEVRLNH